MKFTKKSDVIKQYEMRRPSVFGEAYSRNAASIFLKNRANEFEYSEKYDVFLSHAYTDARIVRQVRRRLLDLGLSVYVDWIEDKQLDRGNVNSSTALVLRNRMNNCGSLIYLTSDAAEKSVWMPWELGYMDSFTNRVAIAPIVDDDDAEFSGREYLSIYPYIELTDSYSFARQSDGKFKSVDGWVRDSYEWIVSNA